MMEFGELIEPDTRAFWGDYDEFEEDGDNLPTLLSWKWMEEDNSNIERIEPFKNLFIVDGQQIFDFIQTAVLKKLSPICQIDGHKISVYKLPDTGDFMCVSEDNDLDQSAQISELLGPWLEKADETFVFAFKSAYTYNTNEQFDKRCFIRTISNTTVEHKVDGITPMEDCNILYGLSAGASTWRHIHKLPFICYTVYMDCMKIDSLVASIVLKLFKKLNLKCDTNYILKEANKSNLYM